MRRLTTPVFLGEECGASAIVVGIASLEADHLTAGQTGFHFHSGSRGVNRSCCNGSNESAGHEAKD